MSNVFFEGWWLVRGRFIFLQAVLDLHLSAEMIPS